MSQPGRHQLEHLPLGRIRQRVWSQFWLGCGGPCDILTRKQAVCHWGISCEALGWYHITRLFHRLSPSQRRDQLPAAVVQRHLRDIFRDSSGGQLCYGVSWNHTGLCLVSCIFQDTRWSEYWSFVPGPCIGSWSVQWVYNWVGQYGPCLVCRSGLLLLLSTDQETPQRSISCLVSLLGSSVCPQGDISTNCCGSHQVQVHGFGFHDWPPQIPQSERFVADFSVGGEVNFHLLLLPFYGLECSTVVGGGGVVCEYCCMLICNIFGVGDGSSILPI